MNILIVEDEPPILRDIEYTINALQEDYTVYATAMDGQNAIALLEQHRGSIDVLITDIHIPILNGLELISYVHQNMPGIYCIIISGYSEFEYARKAVKLGVIEYLLKPVNEKELQSLLKKIYSKWCMNYLLGENPLKLQGFCAAKSLFTYSLAILRLHPLPAASSFETQTQAEPRTELKLDTFLSRQPDYLQYYCITEGCSPMEKHLLLTHINSCTSTDLFPSIIFQEILVACCYVTIVIHTGFDESRPVKEHFDSLHSYLWENMILEQSQLLIYKVEEKKNLSSTAQIMLSNHISVLYKLFTELNITMFYTELEQLLQKMKGLHMSQKDISSYLHMLSDLCVSSIPGSNACFDISYSELLKQIVNQSDAFARLSVSIKTFFHSLFDLFLEETPASSAACSKETLLLRIDKYIMKNCFEVINTKSIADKFGFTPAYLSKLFYQYKKVSPMDFIIQLRMEKAKELFQDNPELRIKEIAAHVGYPDSLYFSKVFRKYTGKSPKQYMKQNKNKAIFPTSPEGENS